MSVKLITENIWNELTKAAKNSKIKSFVAVAYFGKVGAERLPLSKGSTLLVDASEGAVSKGQSCPEELLKLYKKGVKIFSKEGLHAKLFIIGKTLYIGSTNVSDNSENYFIEAVLKTTDRDAVAEAKFFIQKYCSGLDLGEEQLLKLQKIYNPPKGFKASTSGKNKSGTELPPFHVCHLELVNYSEEEEKQSQKGKKEAARKFQNNSRHISNEFLWTNELKGKFGDTILQITEEEEKSYVSPPGTLYHLRKWGNGTKQKIFCYVEIPKQKRRKNLEYFKKYLTEKEYQSILRDGVKNNIIAGKIISLWK